MGYRKEYREVTRNGTTFRQRYKVGTQGTATPGTLDIPPAPSSNVGKPPRGLLGGGESPTPSLDEMLKRVQSKAAENRDESPANPDGITWVSPPTMEPGTNLDEAYKGFHQAPGPEGDNSLANLDDIYPDIVDHPEWYCHYQNSRARREDADQSREERETVALIRAARDNPTLTTVVYRAVPLGVSTINPGDWVSTSRVYAEHHGVANTGEQETHLLAMRVPVSQLYSDGGSILEWGWTPVDAE